MTDAEVITDEIRALRRRTRLVLLLFAFALVGVPVAGFFIGRDVPRVEFYLFSAGLIVPALVGVFWLQFVRPLPPGQARMIAGEQWDEKTLWIGPFIGLVCLVLAAADIASPRFSLATVGLPLLVLGRILGRYRRGGDDFGRATAARALIVGMVAATLSLSGLVAVAAFAPGWLVRLTSLALAAPMAIAATTYAILMRQAYREA